jgi:5-methyltetrahydropteroyltriglutamate--homocysteine methyltransferase
MARGTETAAAMSMTKWFNTNYHYIAPELGDKQSFKLDASKILAEYAEAKALGVNGKINVIGPLTFLALAKDDGGETVGDSLVMEKHFDAVLAVYAELLGEIAKLDSEAIFVQFDEPIFVRDPSAAQLDLLKKAYQKLTVVSQKINIIVTTYFEHSNEATKILATLPVWGLGLDFVHGAQNLDGLTHLGETAQLHGKYLAAGVVDGRGDLDKRLFRVT